MKKLFTLIILLNSLLSLAQTCPTNRYLDPLFSVTKQSNVVFGNAPAIPAVYVSESVTIDQDLTMDVFQPTGDTASKRPLIIFAFGGGYIFGTKDDSDIQGLCDYFAQRGYVTASINYRKGLNATSNTSAVRAIYRAAQDFSSAIRWFKHFSSNYKVDTNYIFVGGSSAGSFSAMHAVFMEDSDRPQETFADGFPNFMPSLGCLTCTGNNYPHTNQVKGILNCWGALLNKNFIDAGDKVDILSVHGTVDPIVPYNSGSPFSASLIVQSVDGSAPIHTRAQQVGLQSKLLAYEGEGHCVWGICVLNAWAPGSPTQYYNPILDSMRLHMYPMLRPSNANIVGPTQVCQGDTAVYWTNGSDATRFCWQISGGIIIESTPNNGAIKVIWGTTGQATITLVPYSGIGAAGSAVSIPVEVNSYPAIPVITQQGDTLSTASGLSYQWYQDGQVISGATENTYIISQTGNYSVQVTNTGGCSVISDAVYAEHTVIQPNSITENNIGIKLYPNPSNGIIVLEGATLSNISIYNSMGQLCNWLSVEQLGAKTTINHALPKGVYYLKATTANATLAKIFAVE